MVDRCGQWWCSGDGGEVLEEVFGLQNLKVSFS